MGRVSVGIFATLVVIFTGTPSLSAPSAVQLAQSWQNTCALAENGTLKCWGNNLNGQLGAGNTLQKLLPQLVSLDDKTVAAVTSSFEQVCVLFESGKAKCWGGNQYGQLGLGLAGLKYGDTAATIPSKLAYLDLGKDRTIRKIGLGENHGCALLDNYTVKCWGRNNLGQLGLEDIKDRGKTAADMGDKLPAVDVGPGDVMNLYVGGWHNCVLLKNGSVKCWGSGRALGRGATMNIGVKKGDMGDKLPAIALGTNVRVKHVATGAYSTCVLTFDGRVKCWGDNNSGVLGIGKAANVLVGGKPAEMGDNLPYVDLEKGLLAEQLSCGYYHCCALLENGGMKCWGNNIYGQLGLGDQRARGLNSAEMGQGLSFVDLGKLASVRHLNLGGYHTCVQKEDGEVVCWGWNSRGQLGTGDVIMKGNLPNHMGDNLIPVRFQLRSDE